MFQFVRACSFVGGWAEPTKATPWLRDWKHSEFIYIKPMVLNGRSINFQGGSSPYELYNIENLIYKFIKSYFCFCNI